MKKMLVFLLLGLLFMGSSELLFAAKGNKHSKPANAIKAKQQLVTCPVTGNKIDPAKAYARTTYKGKNYYFCCAGCPEEFKKNPGKYAK